MGPDPALLVVSHPESFLDALILVAALERHVRCLVRAGLIRGLLQSLLARGLGVISFPPENRQAVVEKCAALLAEKVALVTFVEPDPAPAAGGNAASLAVEAELRQAGGLGLKLFPVHLFLPVGHTHTRELLIDIDQPEMVDDYISSADSSGNDPEQALGRRLKERCQENSFRLQPADLAVFLGDLEQVLRHDLEEELRSQPAQKQKLEGFELSRFVIQWAEQMNYLHPGLLVSLWESLEAWVEARRLGALHRLEVEGATAWLKGPLGRSVVVLETVAGFALGVYGLLNHLPALLLLYLTGLLNRQKVRDPITAWLERLLVILASYGVQAFLVAHFWGRRAAGLYVPTLPLSALYLWRYAWLLRHHTRIAFLSFNRAAEVARAVRLRKVFLHEINQALELHAEMLGLPH